MLLHRYLGTMGVSLPSERAMRTQQSTLLKDNIIGKMVPLLFKSSNANGSHGFETKEVPCVTVKDVSTMVLDYLDRHDR